MNIILSAVKRDLADAWQKHCGNLPNVTVHRGSILDLSVDAVVSPANSFGFMDGGIDRIYTMHFGSGVELRLQKLIRERHHGELVVGGAEIVETLNTAIPYVIAAPTMRVPMILKNTVNPYLAARAALLLVRHGLMERGPSRMEPVASVVRTVAFPGLGTGVGQVSFDVCARQMRRAIEDVTMTRPFPADWSEAQRRHQLMYATSVRDLQNEEF